MYYFIHMQIHVNFSCTGSRSSSEYANRRANWGPMAPAFCPHTGSWRMRSLISRKNARSIRTRRPFKRTRTKTCSRCISLRSLLKTWWKKWSKLLFLLCRFLKTNQHQIYIKQTGLIRYKQNLDWLLWSISSLYWRVLGFQYIF